MTDTCCGDPKCDGQGCKAPVPAITRDQATALVGKTVLAKLEDIIAAHEAVLADPEKSETQKANARLVITSAQGFGKPLYLVVKATERPRILRPQRSIRVVR